MGRTVLSGHDNGGGVANRKPIGPVQQCLRAALGASAEAAAIPPRKTKMAFGDEVHRVLASLAVKLHDRLGHAGSQRYPAVAATFPAAIDRESTCQRGVSRGLAPHLMPGSGKSSV
jgi:hypothetical protein